VLERRGQNLDAVEHFQRAQEIATELADDLALGKALYGLGRAYATLRDYEKAVQFKKDALTILERRGDTTMMAKACTSIGNDLCTMGLSDEGMRYLDRAAELANAVGDLSTVGYATSSLAGCKLYQGDLKGAEDLIQRCLPISTKLNDPLMTVSLLFYSGYIHTHRHEWSSAREDFEGSIAILRKLDAPARLGQWLMEIADIYAQNNDREEARSLLDEAYEIAIRLGHEKLIKQVEENRERLCT